MPATIRFERARATRVRSPPVVERGRAVERDLDLLHRSGGQKGKEGREIVTVRDHRHLHAARPGSVEVAPDAVVVGRRVAERLASEEGDVRSRRLAGMVPVDVGEEGVDGGRGDEPRRGRVEELLVAVGAGQVAAEARDHHELGGGLGCLDLPLGAGRVDESPVLLVGVDDEARVAERVRRQVGGEGAAAGQPLERTGIPRVEQRGLAGEGLDEQHLVAPRDRGEDGVAGQSHGVSRPGRRPVTVMLRMRTPPFS